MLKGYEMENWMIMENSNFTSHFKALDYQIDNNNGVFLSEGVVSPPPYHVLYFVASLTPIWKCWVSPCPWSLENILWEKNKKQIQLNLKCFFFFLNLKRSACFFFNEQVNFLLDNNQGSWTIRYRVLRDLINMRSNPSTS